MFLFTILLLTKKKTSKESNNVVNGFFLIKFTQNVKQFALSANDCRINNIRWTLAEMNGTVYKKLIT